MYVAYVSATIAAIAADAFSGVTALVELTAEMTAVAQAGVPEVWPTLPIETLTSVAAPGLLLGLFGVPLFGIFGSVILVMFFASVFGGRSREHGNPSGLGLVIGFSVFFIIMLVLNVALR